MIELSPALLNRIQLGGSTREKAQFDRRTRDELTDFLRSKVRRVIQDDTDFLPEFRLQCTEQVYRDVAVEVALAREKERLVLVAYTAQQFQTLPSGRTLD